uniref:Endonuclease/exonuclease/phosphatase domain-containing protein n=1 Tax=Pygocentrus nattereri TaxID=42514 RepID=A0AAR2IU02_PYGNA
LLFVVLFLFTVYYLDSHCLILGGDFNCCLDPVLDRSSLTAVPLSKSGKIIKVFLEQYALLDPWRLLNPNKREYSFFSPVHQTYSLTIHVTSGHHNAYP